MLPTATSPAASWPYTAPSSPEDIRQSEGPYCRCRSRRFHRRVLPRLRRGGRHRS
ncbi:hypothetical protein NNX37_02580 [Arthrobacter sp. zg-Y108]|nr:hypothetical protein [Arthrobacter zhaoxinii]MCQ1999582.1 hypothetical protein [Arthrobacter zhaoxinii]